MRKALWSVIALIALLSGTGVILGGGAVSAADTTVNIVDGSGDPTKTWKFEPAEISVAAGSKVVWKNTGNQPHTATADDGSFDSGYLSNGKEFSQVVTKSITYKCEPHPWMTGKINVTGGAPSPAPAQQSAPTTAAPAPAAGSTPTTRVAAAAAPASTTTTAKAAAGASTTTTTAGGGATSTTQAPSVTPTSAPETGGVTTTTTTAPGGAAEEAAADGHGSEGSKSEGDDKSSPLGIAFASVSTLVLLAISGKLLVARS